MQAISCRGHWSIVLALCCTGSLVTASLSQERAPSPNPQQELQRFNELSRQSRALREQGNYLGSVRVLRHEWEERWSKEDAETGGLSRRVGLQIFAEALQSIGCYREAQQRLLDRDPPTSPLVLSADAVKAFRQTPMPDAEGLVLAAAKRRQIVILNETHYQPEHRLFGARLVGRLKKLGFDYLALETRSQAPLDEAARTGRVRLDTEYYVFEPQRAGLLRAALRAGMRLVAFDYWSDADEAEMRKPGADGQQIRETAMARNIDEQILRRDPKAKILVWVGMGHACKVPLGRSGLPPLSPMARELWQRTGIEPFSIYQQSDAGAPSSEGRAHELLAAASRRVHRPVGVVVPLESYSHPVPDPLRRHSVYSGMIRGGIDAWIIHPPGPVEHGVERPKWLRPEGGAEVRGRVRRSRAPAAGYLVQALPERGSDLAAPADQVVTDSEGRYCLRMPPGSYRLRVWAPKEGSVEERVVAVTALKCGIAERRRRSFVVAGG